jgi:tRNA (cytidine/uridine-2'-O-)-methyltransferase
MAACFGLAVRIIEPAGFILSDSNFRRAGLDYVDKARLVRHPTWAAFQKATAGRRAVLLSTKAALPYTDFAFAASDIILMGRESAGVPDHVHAAADAKLLIPMRPGLRSLNVALACAMVTGEALRQTKGFPSA